MSSTRRKARPPRLLPLRLQAQPSKAQRKPEKPDERKAKAAHRYRGGKAPTARAGAHGGASRSENVNASKKKQKLKRRSKSKPSAKKQSAMHEAEAEEAEKKKKGKGPASGCRRRRGDNRKRRVTRFPRPRFRKPRVRDQLRGKSSRHHILEYTPKYPQNVGPGVLSRSAYRRPNSSRCGYVK